MKQQEPRHTGARNENKNELVVDCARSPAPEPGITPVYAPSLRSVRFVMLVGRDLEEILGG
jgi:hypothetical protein